MGNKKNVTAFLKFKRWNSLTKICLSLFDFLCCIEVYKARWFNSMLNSICVVKTSVVQWLGSMHTFNTSLQWYRQQFSCTLHIALTKSLCSFGLYNVHEKSLIKGQCGLHLKQWGKRGKALNFSSYINHYNSKTCKFCLCGHLTTVLQKIRCD